jgi:type IV fimbrial biogenesis protein FimT
MIQFIGNNRRIRQSVGFSLIELLITLSILAIATTIAVPSFASLVKTSKSGGARDQIMMILYSARNSAITQRRDIIVCAGSQMKGCTRNWQDGAIMFADVNRNRMLDRTESVSASVGQAELQGVELRGNRAFTRFDLRGRASGTNQTIRVCLPGESEALSVVIGNSGRIRSGKAHCS